MGYTSRLQTPTGQNGMYHRTTASIKTNVLLVTALALSGCDVLFDNVIDCLDSDGPDFDRRELAMPVLNQVYSEILTARIENEPGDDRFDYSFELIGQLPSGITWRQEEFFGRRIFFEGTAVELGSSEFTLLVAVQERDTFSQLNSGLCFTSRSRQFTLDVQPL